MGHVLVRVEEARLDILPLEPRIGLQERFGRVAGGELSQNVLDREAASADDGFPP
jgi:hypothetical protein